MLTTADRPSVVRPARASALPTNAIADPDLAGREESDGTWSMDLALPRWPARDAKLSVWAPSHRALQEQVGLWRPLLAPLQDLALALVENDARAARLPFSQLAECAARLRSNAIEAYVRQPQATVGQCILGLICLAMGRRNEAYFHLLRAGSNWQQGATRGLLLGAGAMHLVGDDLAARTMLAALRRGMEIARISAICASFAPHVMWSRPDLLRHVRGVVQVGASVGDEAGQWRALGVREWLAFEPDPRAYASLVDTLRRETPPGSRWCAVPLVVSDRCGAVEFWQGEQSGNSSLFDLHPERSAFHHANRHAGKIELQATTLDAYFAAQPALLERFNLLFVDVQGAEHLVIEGGRRSLRSIDYVCMELSETEIYVGSWSIARMDALMLSCGFDKVAQSPNGFPEQVDALYARRGAPRD